MAELALEGGGVDVAHSVEKGVGLRVKGCDDFGMTMSEARDSEGGGEIEEAITICVPDIGALGAFPKDGP